MACLTYVEYEWMASVRKITAFGSPGSLNSSRLPGSGPSKLGSYKEKVAVSCFDCSKSMHTAPSVNVGIPVKKSHN